MIASPASRPCRCSPSGEPTALNEVTVVDPACGSGAYLLGMLQELVDLQTAPVQ